MSPHSPETLPRPLYLMACSSQRRVLSTLVSAAALVDVFRQHGHFDAIVDLVKRDITEAHVMIVDAAIETGIPHIIASAFGVDIRPKLMHELPMMQHKAATDDYLQVKVRQGLITFTAIHTGLFMEWAIENDVVVNFLGGLTTLWGGGDVLGSWTMQDDIGIAVASALCRKHKVLNQVCFVHSGIWTQNRIIGWVRDGAPARYKDITTISVSMDEAIQDAWKAYNGGDRSILTIRAFALVGAKAGYWHFGDGVDNEILGVQIKSEEEM